MSAARFAFRSPPLRRAAAKLAEGGGAPLRRLNSSARRTRRPSAVDRFLRRPAEMSACVETLLPMHSATASALMTSMLSFSRRGYGWLSEAGNDDM